MAFLQLVLKARKVENTRQKYEDEKLTSIAFSRDAKPHLNWRQRIRRKKLRCEKQIKSFWDKVTPCGKNSWPYRKVLSLRTDGTFENYVLKSVFGFFGGIVLTYIFFIFFVFQLNFKLSSAIFLCMVIGIILTLGLAFFHRVRCIVFLLLPQFFSKRGRQALMAYAYILALTGPVKNTLHNIGILSESLACGQEQLKQAVKNIVDLAKQPFYALGNAISKVIKTVKMVVQQIKQTLVAIKRLVLSIARVITSVFQWLGSIINICNKKLGTPFDRCQRVFDGAVADCRAKLGPVIGVICNLTYLVGALCYVVKPLDFICMLVSYVADTVVNAVRAKVKRFAMQMKAMFYVKIKFSHSFQLETNQSKSTREVSTAIITEIRSRADRFFHVFDWMRFITAFFIFFLLLKVMHYRHKWLTKERFDNKYITSDIRTIDIIRTRQDKETVLPLNPRERNKYIPLTSITLIQVEKVRLTKSAVFLGLATLKLIIYLVVDYSLYWILNAIRYHGRFQSKVERPNVVTINVSGEGYLAELYRSIVNTFTPHDREMEVDTVSCLPTPIPPDFDKYVRIATLIIFSWLMAIFEPYGLRLRQVVMCQYYPDRAKQRAAWLYNHIIRSRGNFLKFARRQLRRKFGITEGEKIERVTLRERLTAICPFLNILFPLKQNTCLLCGAIEVSDKNLHIKCSSPGCVGLFCTQCFADLQNICTICKSPIEYGDLSDMSEERDSSEDQLPTDDRILKYKPGKIDEEMELKRVEIAEKKSKDEIDDRETEDIDRTSDSSYSYTYQDESAEEVSMEDERKPFKDVEGQKIRDDVTTRIFEEASITEASSDAETPIEHFAAREDKKFRARLKKKSRISSSGVTDSVSSTSIADTESWPTEEVDEEEVIRTEIEDDDDSKELLLKDRMTEEKLGRVNKLTGAVSRIPWLSKRKTSDTGTDKKRRRKRSSLVSKLVDIVQRKPTELTETISDEETKEYSSVSSSSFSLSDAEEDGALLKTKDRSTVEEQPAEKEFSYNYFIDRDSQIPCPGCETSENQNLHHPCRKEFTTKELPRYLESVSQRSSYFEVDETKEQRARGKCIRQVNKVNALSDAKSSSHSGKGDNWNIITENDFFRSCSCTSESTYKSIVNKSEDLHGMSTISEHAHDVENFEADSETESRTKSEVDSQTEIRTKSETDSQTETRTKSETYSKAEDTTDPSQSETVETEETESPESSRKLESQREEISVTQRQENLQDPFAGLELYGVRQKSKKQIKFSPATNSRKTVADESRFAYSKQESLEDKTKNAARGKRVPSVELGKLPGSVDEKRSDKKIQGRNKIGKNINLNPLDSKTSTDDSKDANKDAGNSEKNKKGLQAAGQSVFGFRPIIPSQTKENLHRATTDEEISSSQSSVYHSKENSGNFHRQIEWKPCTESSCPCHSRNYKVYSEISTSSEALPEKPEMRERMQKSLEYPVLKKYLPMYQSPELIEELKAHDRMRLIRKREAERRRLSGSPRKDDLVKRCRRENQDNLTSVKRNDAVPVSSKLTKKGMKLPYQETRAFRNLMHQLREKMRQRNERAEQNVPLIQLSKNADKTKEVKQLFPLDDKRNRARSSKIVRKVTKKIVGALKPYSDKGERSRNQERSMRRKLLPDEFYKNYTSDPEFLSDASSVCKCSGTTNDSNVPSEEGTTDNNESTR